MKLELANRKTQVFLGVLAITAVSINWYFWQHRRFRSADRDFTALLSSQPTQTQNIPAAPVGQAQAVTPPAIDSAAATREAAQAAEVRRQNEVVKAAEARKQYLARYLNSGSARKSGANLVAVVAASEDGKIERNLIQALSNHLRTSGVEIASSFFKPELVSDRLLDELFAESTQLRQNLELDKSLDGLVLARVAVEYSSNPALQDVITARLSLDVSAQAMGASGASKTWTLNVSGAGFDRRAARAMAQERILKEIENDKKMSLGSILTAK